MVNLEKITTERRNPATMNIDNEDTLSICKLINNEDKNVALAIEKILPQIAIAVDNIVDKMKTGGRLFYIGAGTSGRLGVLDAAECPPTYSVPPELIQGLIAGGKEAMFRAQEGAEDNENLAAADLAEKKLTANDVVIGIAASGRTPYVIGGLKFAKKNNAATISIACSAKAPISNISDIALEAVTGAEVITGSTRMKAGTAQKLILNMLSTASMIRLGKVYQNLMVDVNASNDKLYERACRIVMEATDITHEKAAKLLKITGGKVKPAIIMHLMHIDFTAAQKLLKDNDGFIRRTITANK
ncbi:N-acetylmuramic acid 6-phosphate etherase [Pectinatus brassicae]|uniref:N-acetylmuramic acid 6-phosphate etherase n=1 Tax=Pectinatus brassicae TaxID=862415 RepID=A0A840ULZ9_9FIRM|nr:N-acetylmuramic acid 6-phosphate etherase [Pectinatus brassicae]MBB5337220.1 N-acetylmuramic acid 6-phosphate etherase [Pectinatus brassicae]